MHESFLTFQPPTFPSDENSRIVKEKLIADITVEELELVNLVRKNRPSSLREYDQIPMRSLDLLCQAKLIAPYLEDQDVVFIGDHDGTSILLGLLATKGIVKSPRKMLLLDFDARLTNMAGEIAKETGFANRLTTQMYNVFDPMPTNLVSNFDWFYTNPPYGSNNSGASTLLFLSRGIECLRKEMSSRGGLIVPGHNEREWTLELANAISDYLKFLGWGLSPGYKNFHRYHLDDDESLTSSTFFIVPERTNLDFRSPQYTGKRAPFNEFPMFYSKQDNRYPRYILPSGDLDFNWNKEK